MKSSVSRHIRAVQSSSVWQPVGWMQAGGEQWLQLSKLSPFLVLKCLQKCCLPWIFYFYFFLAAYYICFYLNLSFSFLFNEKCHGNCHKHKETIPLGLTIPINKLLA